MGPACNQPDVQTSHSSDVCCMLQVEREIAIHSSLSHPNIVDFVSVRHWRQPRALLATLPHLQTAGIPPLLACLQYAAFEDEQGIYLVLEFAERVGASHGTGLHASPATAKSCPNSMLSLTLINDLAP